MKFYRPLAAAVVSLVVSVSAFAQKIVFQGRVNDTLDGSTVVVETQSKAKFVVKCQATTAPHHGEPHGEYSRQRLASLVLKQMVLVEYTERNKDGHILGTIFLKDGTWVDPHKRTAPDGKFDNNWTTIGNVNPYTGKPGTKSWFARNWWIFPTVGALVGTGFLLNKYSGGGGGTIFCNDGTISPAQNRQGACSHHGGIRR